PPGILAVLRKMMAKDPDDRYQTPIEVADALAEWAEQPVAAPPTREMPGLCPLVLGLTGHTLSKSGPIPALAKSLTAGGGSSVRGGPGSSAGRNPRSAAPGVSTARYEQTGGPAPAPRPRVAAPNSTARASGARTAPMPPRPPSSSGVAIENKVPKDP